MADKDAESWLNKPVLLALPVSNSLVTISVRRKPFLFFYMIIPLPLGVL